jgi:hypothetical protein
LKAAFFRLCGVAISACLLPGIATADILAFGPDLRQAGWETVSFFRIPATSFRAAGLTTLEIDADKAAGLIWRPLPAEFRAARRASWRWRASQAVPVTDLTRKGADDRVLSVYFLFGDAGDVGRGVMSMLTASDADALVYVYGGGAPRGTILPSPHMGSRGQFIMLRPADAPLDAWMTESVDLAQDYARAFGRQPRQLLGLAVSSDADDTGSRNRAMLQDLNVIR